MWSYEGQVGTCKGYRTLPYLHQKAAQISGLGRHHFLDCLEAAASSPAHEDQCPLSLYKGAASITCRDFTTSGFGESLLAVIKLILPMLGYSDVS